MNGTIRRTGRTHRRTRIIAAQTGFASSQAIIELEECTRPHGLLTERCDIFGQFGVSVGEGVMFPAR
jgi:hypothetical protein